MSEAAGIETALALGLALLLGLRHATDPDHLTALLTLVASGERNGARRASTLGLCWGLGHAVTCFALGCAALWAGAALPQAVARAAEALVGLLIFALATRLLWRWRRGTLHAHPHRHAGLRHAHPHVHTRAHGPAEAHSAAHEHRHAEALGRNPPAAFAIGLLHGVGGSAAAAALLVVSVADDTPRAIALLLGFSVASAAAMAGASAALGAAFVRAPMARHVERILPAIGVVGVAFGAWYTLAALLPGAFA